MCRVLSAVSQTAVLSLLQRYTGPRASIVVGLLAQLAQLVCYGTLSCPVTALYCGAGVMTNTYAVWVGGLGIALSSTTYAAVSSYASLLTDKDKQVRDFAQQRLF